MWRVKRQRLFVKKRNYFNLGLQRKNTKNRGHCKRKEIALILRKWKNKIS